MAKEADRHHRSILLLFSNLLMVLGIQGCCFLVELRNREVEQWKDGVLSRGLVLLFC